MRTKINAISAMVLAAVLVACDQVSYIHVTSEKLLRLEAADAWERIGGICDIQRWHPAVAKCSRQDGQNSIRRTVTLVDGTVMIERIINQKEMSYSYVVESGARPVSEYETYLSTFSVERRGNQPLVRWAGRFRARGAADQRDAAAIKRIYDGGLYGIEKLLTN